MAFSRVCSNFLATAKYLQKADCQQYYRCKLPAIVTHRGFICASKSPLDSSGKRFTKKAEGREIDT